MNTLYYHYGIRYIGIFLQIRHLVANLFLIFLYLRGDVQKMVVIGVVVRTTESEPLPLSDSCGKTTLFVTGFFLLIWKIFDFYN